MAGRQWQARRQIVNSLVSKQMNWAQKYQPPPTWHNMQHSSSFPPAHPQAHRQQRGSSSRPPPVVSHERWQLASPLPQLLLPSPGCCQTGAWPLEQCWLPGASQQSRALACLLTWRQLLVLLPLLLRATVGCRLAWQLQGRCGACHLKRAAAQLLQGQLCCPAYPAAAAAGVAAAPGLLSPPQPQVCPLLPVLAAAPSVQPASRQKAALEWCT